eukprot:6720078-Pyramimonas_sp.AAC.1
MPRRLFWAQMGILWPRRRFSVPSGRFEGSGHHHTDRFLHCEADTLASESLGVRGDHLASESRGLGADPLAPVD